MTDTLETPTTPVITAEAPLLVEAKAEKTVLKFPDNLTNEQRLKARAIECAYQSFEVVSQITSELDGLDFSQDENRLILQRYASIIKNTATNARSVWQNANNLVSPDIPSEDEQKYNDEMAKSVAVVETNYKNTFGKETKDNQRPLREFTFDEEKIETAFILLSTAHHDIGNVINPISGGIDLASTYDLDDETMQIAYNELVIPNIPKLRDRTKDMRDLIEGGFSKEPISIASVFSDLNDAMKTYLTKAGIPFHHSSLTPDLGKQKIMYSKLMSKLLAENLAANARKATDKSPRPYQVAYSFAIIDEGGKSYLQITIVDTGPGYPQDIIDNGFRAGFTNWQEKEGEAKKGTGYAMANNVKTLKDVYEASLIPSNRTDKDGNVIGAETIIKIPLA